MINDWQQEFAETFGEKVKFNVPMKEHTTFHAGGNAWGMVFPAGVEDIIRTSALSRKWKMDFIPIGHGSNILCPDSGYKGIIVNLAKDYRGFRWEEREGRYVLRAEAGAALTQMIRVIGAEGIGGLEFACGIPGTMGGAVSGNAGAFGDSIMEHISSIEILKKTGEVISLDKGSMNYGYRYTELEKGAVVISVEMILDAVNPEEFNKSVERFMKERRMKQPSEPYTAGSIFKNPEGDSAGSLIDAAGLKGVSVGGAVVSMKHANFIINCGNASARDILELINIMHDKVFAKTGISLEPEIKIIGKGLQ